MGTQLIGPGTLPHQPNTFAKHICAGHLGVLFREDRKNREALNAVNSTAM